MDPDTTLDTSRLFFIISQPRSGSTLLQRMLASHSGIHTTSEPWLLVSPLTALQEPGREPPLQRSLEASGMRDFLRALPGGINDYHAALRRMYGGLYLSAAEHAGKRCFVDKTPRYTRVFEQLCAVFPDANYVFLVRNPLAVLVSIVRTWCTPNRFNLHHFRHDLLQAPRVIAAALRHAPARAATIRFEELASNPAAALQSLCRDLNIQFEEGMLNYGQSDLPKWELGDQARVYQHDQAQGEAADAWQAQLRSPQIWSWCRNYLRALGPDVIAALGFNYAELEAMLAAAQPRKWRQAFCVPLNWWLYPAGASLRRVFRRTLRRLGRLYRMRPADSLRAVARKLKL